MKWTADSPEAAVDATKYTYQTEATFTDDFQHVLFELDSAHPAGGGSWMLSKFDMSTPETIYYSDNGYDVSLELKGLFNGDLTSDNYKDQVKAITFHWWPEEYGNEVNFVNQLRASAPAFHVPVDCFQSFGVAIVPEPSACVLFGFGLLALFYHFRRKK